MRLFYCNAPATGLSVIVGEIDTVAHTVEANGYRDTDEALAAELAAIESEYGTTETVRFDTAEALEAAYGSPMVPANIHTIAEDIRARLNQIEDENYAPDDSHTITADAPRSLNDERFVLRRLEELIDKLGY